MSKKTIDKHMNQKEIHKQVQTIIERQEKRISIDSGRETKNTASNEIENNHASLKKNLL